MAVFANLQGKFGLWYNPNVSILTDNINGSTTARLSALAKNLMDVFASNSGNPGSAGYVAQAGQLAYTASRGTVLAVHAGATLANYFNKIAPVINSAEVMVQRISPFLSRIAMPITIITGAIKAGDHFYKGDDRDGVRVLGYTAGTLAGVFAGAAAGGALGSVIPIVGTGIGAAAGAVIFSVGGGAAMKAAAGVVYDAITANPAPQLAPG
jgi:hypothetical protein